MACAFSQPGYVPSVASNGFKQSQPLYLLLLELISLSMEHMCWIFFISFVGESDLYPSLEKEMTSSSSEGASE